MPFRLFLALSLLLPVAAAGAQSIEAAGDTRRTGDAARVRAEIADGTGIPSVSPQGADVTLVLFSDYQCPYCRRLHPAIERLKTDDSKLRIVYRDLPIFGAVSRQAARTAIAASYQGRHAAFNDALMRTPGRISPEAIRRATVTAKLDPKRLSVDLKTRGDAIDAAIARTGRYAAMLGLSGTPAMLIGPYLIPGAVDLATLKKAVAAARAR